MLSPDSRANLSGDSPSFTTTRHTLAQLLAACSSSLLHVPCRIYETIRRICGGHPRFSISIVCFVGIFIAWRLAIGFTLGFRGTFWPAFPESRTLFVTTLLTIPIWGLCMCCFELWLPLRECLWNRHSRGDYEPIAVDLDQCAEVTLENDDEWSTGCEHRREPWRSKALLGYFSLFLFGVFMVHTSKAPVDHRFKSAVDLATRTPRREGYGTGEKIFIAAMFYNNAVVLPYWSTEVLKLINYLGPDNVFVSILESYSTDNTPALLRDFEAKLGTLDVPHRIVTQDTSIPRPQSMKTLPPRVEFLAATRNLAIEPLTQGNASYDRLLFINDIFIEAESIAELLNTRDGDYDMACGLDFQNWGVYDLWVLRDRLGRLASAVYPYFLEDAGFRAVVADEPAPVFSCWNGVASIRAEPFLPPSMRRGRLSAIPIARPLPPTHPGYPRPANMTPAAEPPLRFRGSFLPPDWDPSSAFRLGASTPAFDSAAAAPHECFSSESFLLPYDLRRVFGLHKIYVNPRVVSAYIWKYYVWFKWVVRHWAVRAWMEWVENGSGMHLGKVILGDPTEVWRWDGGECHPGPW